MPEEPTLHIEQESRDNGKYTIKLTLERAKQGKLTAKATIEFALTPQEQEDLRWYLEDYLQKANIVEKVQVEQIENLMKQRRGALQQSPNRQPEHTGHLVRHPGTTRRPPHRDHERHRRSRLHSLGTHARSSVRLRHRAARQVFRPGPVQSEH